MQNENKNCITLSTSVAKTLKNDSSFYLFITKELFANGPHNDNSDLVTDFLEGTDSVLADSYLRKRPSQQYTFAVGARNQKAWLHHITLSGKWRHNSGCSIHFTF